MAAPAVNAAHDIVDDLLCAPWRHLDDAALLAHFSGVCGEHVVRNVVYAPVIDADECSPERIDGVIVGHFSFVGESHALPDPIDWLANPSRDVEWHILLHKFYYAVGLAQRWRRHGDMRALARWQQLIEGWMAQTPPGFIAADVTGRRVQNWIYSLHGLVLGTPHPAPIDPAFWRRLLHSLHVQVEFLFANLTPKRNHRTLELLAILLAGVVFPEFQRAAAWRAFALEQTLINVQADLLEDGVHCELSTDYHHLALRNWMQVRTLAADNAHAVPPALDRALETALEFAMHIHQPSGSMPSFSDGDVRGFLPLLAQGAALFGRPDFLFVATGGREGTPPRQRVAHFASSGYHVVRSGWAGPHEQHLVFDCGPLGEGNHGHFDALSFELAAHGQALVVDPARFTYSESTSAEDPTNWRVHFRGTAAHNTVCIDGRNQTRYEPRHVKDASRHALGSMRHRITGPAPDTTLQEAVSGEAPDLSAIDLLHARCVSHAYRVVHDRCVVFVDGHYWIVSDWLRTPPGGQHKKGAWTANDAMWHDLIVNFQLGAQAQGVATLASDEGGFRLSSPGLVAAQPRRARHTSSLSQGWVSQRYGHKHAAPAWRTHVRAQGADFDTVLLPWATRAPTLRVADLEVRSIDGRRGNALRIDIDTEGDVANARIHDGWFHARGDGTGPWRIGDWLLTGRWLHWRRAQDGRLLRATSHAGATLVSAIDGRPSELL